MNSEDNCIARRADVVGMSVVLIGVFYILAIIYYNIGYFAIIGMNYQAYLSLDNVIANGAFPVITNTVSMVAGLFLGWIAAWPLVALIAVFFVVLRFLLPRQRRSSSDGKEGSAPSPWYRGNQVLRWFDAIGNIVIGVLIAAAVITFKLPDGGHSSLLLDVVLVPTFHHG